MRFKILTTTVFGLVCIGSALITGAEEKDIIPNGKGNYPKNNPQNGNARGGTGISYHGGPLILGQTNVHYIWYGNWSGNSAPTILTNFARNIGGSNYFNINTTYYNGAGVHVSNSVFLADSVDDAYSRGTSLSDADVQAIVAAHNP